MKNGIQNRLIQYQKIIKKNQILHDASIEMFEQGTVKDVFQMDYAFVIGPMLVSFAEWLIEKAKADGVKRLYFLARDGYALYQVVTLLVKDRGEAIECRYVHCSRYSLRKAEYHLDISKAIDYICLDGIEVSFYRMMKRAGLSLTETELVAQEILFCESVHTALGGKKIVELKGKLGDSLTFVECVHKYSSKEYPLVMGYLTQEGFYDDLKCGIVDSGWVGSMQRTLEILLKTRDYKINIQGYYFGLYEIPLDQDISKYASFYFSPKRDILRKTYFSNNLFECICSSEEGMTVGYSLVEGVYKPNFEKNKNPNQERVQQGIVAIKLYIMLYLKYYHAYSFKMSISENLSILKDLLYFFSGHPLNEEVNLFGYYVFCDDVIGEQKQYLAAEFNTENIKQLYFTRTIINKLKRTGVENKGSAWIYGSIVKTKSNPNVQLKRAALGRCAIYLLKLLQN